MYKNQNESELLKLVELAESVSDRVKSLSQKLSKIKMSLIISTSIYLLGLIAIFFLSDGYFINKYIPLIFIVEVSIGVFTLFSIYVRYIDLRKTRRELSSESRILIKLLEMTDVVKKEEFSSNNNYIEKAIIDMRLSRINFYA